MKIHTLFLLLIAVSSVCEAQEQLTYFGGGSNLSFTKSDALDYIISQYNETRTDSTLIAMSDDMEDIRNVSGVTITLGAIKPGGFMVGMNWSGRNEVVKAQGTPGCLMTLKN